MSEESDHAILLVSGALIAAAVILRVVRVINSKKLSSIFQVSKLEMVALWSCISFVSGVSAYSNKTFSTKVQGGICSLISAIMAIGAVIQILRERRVKPPAPNPDGKS